MAAASFNRAWKMSCPTFSTSWNNRCGRGRSVRRRGCVGLARKSPSVRDLDASLYGGGNGLSKKTAVIVKSGSDYVGVRSEYEWIANRYPGSKPTSQALTAWDHGKRYDRMIVQTSTGQQVVLWFDISAMYR